MTMLSAANAYFLLIAYAFAYSFAKTRQDLGCTRSFFSIHKQCDEARSVYVDGTHPEPGDSLETLENKLVSVLSYSEKAAVWRWCIMLSVVLVLLVYVFVPTIEKTSLVALHLSFLAVHYFYFNYINYHHFRLLKRIGVDILRQMRATR